VKKTGASELTAGADSFQRILPARPADGY